MSVFSRLFNQIKNLDKTSRNTFLIACIIYFFNSIGNVSQGVFIKYFIKNKIDLNLYEFMCFRCIISIVILLPFNIQNIKKYFTLSNRFFALNILISLFYSLDVFLWNLGVQTIPVNNGTIIMLLIPVWISILSRILLKEKDFSIFHLIGFTLCFSGVVLSMEQVSFLGYNQGYLIILINTFIVAIGLILQKKYRHERPVLYSLFLNAVVALCFFFILNHFGTSFKKTVNFNNLISYLLNKDLLLMALVISIFDIMEYAAVYIAYSMYNISSLQPIRFTRIIVSAILSYLLLNEKVTISQFIAIVMIIFGNSILPLSKKLCKKRKI